MRSFVAYHHTTVSVNERPIAIVQNTTPGFFSTMGIPLRRGRDFTAHDTQSAPLVVIINESEPRARACAIPAA